MPLPPRRRKLKWWEKPGHRFAQSKLGGWTYVNVFSRIDPWLLRKSGGRISMSPGQPMLLLTHTGARTGTRRETALQFLAEGDRIVLVASKAGNARHPSWYHNLKANPRCDVIAPGGRSGAYVAHEAEGEERERLWVEVNDLYRGYETYQGRTGRRIPILVLSREATT